MSSYRHRMVLLPGTISIARSRLGSRGLFLRALIRPVPARDTLLPARPGRQGRQESGAPRRPRRDRARRRRTPDHTRGRMRTIAGARRETDTSPAYRWRQRVVHRHAGRRRQRILSRLAGCSRSREGLRASLTITTGLPGSPNIPTPPPLLRALNVPVNVTLGVPLVCPDNPVAEGGSGGMWMPVGQA